MIPDTPSYWALIVNCMSGYAKFWYPEPELVISTTIRFK